MSVRYRELHGVDCITKKNLSFPIQLVPNLAIKLNIDVPSSFQCRFPAHVCVFLVSSYPHFDIR